MERRAEEERQKAREDFDETMHSAGFSDTKIGNKRDRKHLKREAAKRKDGTPMPVPMHAPTDPMKNRPGEKIGAGYFVFRRGERTNRIRPAGFPFEHETHEGAMAEARRLAAMFPGYTFQVFGIVGFARVDSLEGDAT